MQLQGHQMMMTKVIGSLGQIKLNQMLGNINIIIKEMMDVINKNRKMARKKNRNRKKKMKKNCHKDNLGGVRESQVGRRLLLQLKLDMDFRNNRSNCLLHLINH